MFTREQKELFKALKRKDFDTFNRLLGEGVNPNFVYEKKTPLHWAGANALDKFVVSLLSHGADPGVLDEFGEVPFTTTVVHAVREREGIPMKGYIPALEAFKKCGAADPVVMEDLLSIYKGSYKGSLSIMTNLNEILHFLFRGSPSDESVGHLPGDHRDEKDNDTFSGRGIEL